MKKIIKWFTLGVAELIFCFWLLGTSANLVSSPSNFKVWLGILGYISGIVVIPGASITHVATQVNQAKVRQKQLKQAFPDDTTSLIKLLDLPE